MGILGYPNMDDDNQDGAFGDYSDIYSNYSEEKSGAAFGEDDAVSNAQDVVNQQSSVEPKPSFDGYSESSSVAEESVSSGQKNSSLLGYILVLGILLIAAVGMFLYKQNGEKSLTSQEQSMGDYFYDKAAADGAVQGQSEQTAIVDVDLTTNSSDTNVAGDQKVINDKKPIDVDLNEDDVEKPMSAMEKAMLKKKMDAQKESQVGLSSKPVIIPVSAGGRVDPFVPYLQAQAISNTPKFELIAPPTVIPEPDPVLDELVETKISGIMYDSARPSAIVNFGGADQLVHKGDVVKGYKILNITKNSVVIKYKTNIYQATVGQTLDEGINLNPVSNLSSQFGGAYTKSTGNVIQFNN